VTRMLEDGVPLSVVASILGWSPASTARMAKRYRHIRTRSPINVTGGRLLAQRNLLHKVNEVLIRNVDEPVVVNSPIHPWRDPRELLEGLQEVGLVEVVVDWPTAFRSVISVSKQPNKNGACSLNARPIWSDSVVELA
jgi:hypothetical protein